MALKTSVAGSSASRRPHAPPSKAIEPGAPMSWTQEEIAAGRMEVLAEDGSIAVVRWEDGEAEPGWCKLDWVIADTLTLDAPADTHS